MDKVQIEIIFRPISQPAGMPGWRPQGEARRAPRPWQQGTGREPAVRDAKPPSHVPPPTPPREQFKPGVPQASSNSKAPPAPPQGPRPAPQVVAGPPAAVQPPAPSAQVTTPTTPGAKAKPEA
jgi:hypothetical protein